MHFSDQGTPFSSPSLSAWRIKATSVYLHIQIQTASSNPIQSGARVVQEKARLHTLPHLTALLAELGKEGDRGLLGSELGVEEEPCSDQKADRQSC